MNTAEVGVWCPQSVRLWLGGGCCVTHAREGVWPASPHSCPALWALEGSTGLRCWFYVLREEGWGAARAQSSNAWQGVPELQT